MLRKNKKLFFKDIAEEGTITKKDKYSIWINFQNGEKECFPINLIQKEIAEKTIALR